MRTPEEVTEAFTHAQGLVDVIKGWELAGASRPVINLQLLTLAMEEGGEVLTYDFIMDMYRSLWWMMGNDANADAEWLAEHGIDPEL